MDFITKLFRQMDYEIISPLTHVAIFILIALFVLRYLTIKSEKFNSYKYKDIIIGVIFGIISAYASEGGATNVDGVIVNVRNAAPLVSGLVFSGPSGIIAGFIGGIYRWFAVYWGAGMFTRIGCSLACILSGFIACYVKIILNENKKVNFLFAILIGMISEVLHLLLIFLTNVSEAVKAYQVDILCGPYMIVGVAVIVGIAVLLDTLICGEDIIVYEKDISKRKFSDIFQTRLFVIIIIASGLSIHFINATQINAYRTQVSQRLLTNIFNLRNIIAKEKNIDDICMVLDNLKVGENGELFIFDKDLNLLNKRSSYGDNHQIANSNNQVDKRSIVHSMDFNSETMKLYPLETVFIIDINNNSSYCMYDISDEYVLLATYPKGEADVPRNIILMLLIFTQIVIYSSLFAFIFYQIHKSIVVNFKKVNETLSLITKGDLNSKVKVRSSLEFSDLSKDINTMVDSLKNYANEEKLRIEKELELAKKIQTQSLPSIFPAFPNVKIFDIYAYMSTAKEVGGDFYDFYFVDVNRFFFLIADVSGKGVAAAMFMMQSKSFIKSYAEKNHNIEYVANEVNKKLCENNDTNMFVTAFLASIDLTTGMIEYVNAGHNPPIVRRQDGTCEYLTGKRNFIFAGDSDYQYKKDYIKLNIGDEILLYTDGLTEAINPSVEQYGEDRLLAITKKVDDREMNEFVNKIVEDQTRFVNGADQFDDLTILAYKYKGSQDMKELNIEAKVENIEKVTNFVNDELDALNCEQKIKAQIDIAIDELFSNIARYAYDPSVGPATVRVEVAKDPLAIIITFIDHGVPYDPLKKADPNTSLSIDERVEGGLGIFLVKKSMDSIEYEYKDGQNILRIKKKL